MKKTLSTVAFAAMTHITTADAGLITPSDILASPEMTNYVERLDNDTVCEAVREGVPGGAALVCNRGQDALVEIVNNEVFNFDGNDHAAEAESGDNWNDNASAPVYKHRTEDGQPVYSLKYDHMIGSPSREYAGNELSTTAHADLYPKGHAANEVMFSDVRISSVVATLSTNHGSMVERMGAQNIKSGFSAAAELLHVDAFIHDMEVSFLENGKLVARATCETDVIGHEILNLEKSGVITLENSYMSADTITCSWSGPGLE